METGIFPRKGREGLFAKNAESCFLNLVTLRTACFPLRSAWNKKANREERLRMVAGNFSTQSALRFKTLRARRNTR